MELILVLAGVVALVALLKYGALLRVARGIRLRRGECLLKEAGELPAYFADLRAPLETELQALGFTFSHVQLDESPFVGPVSRKWVLVYANAAAGTYAEAALVDIPEPARVFAVTFVTRFSDDYRLMTVSGQTHGIIGSLPRTRLVDPYTEDLARQWAAHREALQGLGGHGFPQRSDPAEYARASSELQKEYIRSLLNEDWIDHTGGSLFRLRLAPALRVALRLLRGQGKLAAMLKRGRKLHEGDAAAVTIPVEIESFRRITHLQQGTGMGWAAKLALLVATMVIFALSFGLGRSREMALTITGVILLHEAGHYLGMRLFNYRDVKVMFLPFMGAVTIGRQPRAALHQRIIVSLLGPVPGIALGTGLLLSPLASVAWVRGAALMLLVINFLNLLPVMPLDGGQVFNLFFSRMPLVRSAFQAAGGAAIIAASAAMGQDRFLRYLGIMVIVGAISIAKYRGAVNRLVRRLPRAGGELSEEALLPLIFAALREGPERTKPFKERFQAATYLLQNVPAAAPSLRLVLGASLAYLAVFAIPLGLFAMRVASSANRAGALTLLSGGGRNAGARERRPPFAPDPRIRLTAAEEELARTLEFEPEIPLRIKQLSGGRIERLSVEDERSQPVPVAGMRLFVPSESARPLIAQSSDELLARGFVLFLDELYMEDDQERLGLIKSADPFEVLRLKRTDGINYGHSTEDIVARLQEWHRRHPLRIVGAGRDWVEVEFKALPPDLPTFAREVVAFCPDSAEQTAEGLEDLAATIKETRRLVLWWD